MKVLAVVIGNNNYFDPDKLKNAVHDAEEMAESFRRLGFDVIEGYDCTNVDCGRILTAFENGLIDYDASIFYYAGHGFQEDGENYLPSIECQISYADKHMLKCNSIQLSELLDIYRKNDKKTHIVILDACRKRSGVRGGGNSFAPVDAPPGTLIAFSTSPNCAAFDSGSDNHSFYTKALLGYIGRERMMVEELFKKVRRTVAQWTHNAQIPWEHTSLIGDFCFNTGQMVASPQLPYKENVVRDSEYDEVGEIADLIKTIKILDYYKQNPAIEKLRAKNADDLDKNQQFIFGRNLLQSSSMANSAKHFMEDLANNLRKYTTTDNENHVLNGILYEIYFDSHGNFRESNIKRNQYFDTIMSLRKRQEYEKSFEFIRTILEPYQDRLIYIIPADDTKLDVILVMREESSPNSFGEDVFYVIISNISINGMDITDKVENVFKWTPMDLQLAIAIVCHAPYDAISLHSNIDFPEGHKNIVFDQMGKKDSVQWWEE